MNAEMLKAMFVSGAVSAAVTFGVVHAASVAPDAQASRAEAAHVAAVPAAPAEAQRPSQAESSAIHEAYSDGGYEDWVEHQKPLQ